MVKKIKKEETKTFVETQEQTKTMKLISKNNWEIKGKLYKSGEVIEVEKSLGESLIRQCNNFEVLK